MTETAGPSDEFPRGASSSTYGSLPPDPPRHHINHEQNDHDRLMSSSIDQNEDDQLLNPDERNVFSSFLYSLEHSDSDFLQPPHIQPLPSQPNSAISIPPPSLSPTSPRVYSSSTASFYNISPGGVPDDPMFSYHPAILSAMNFSSLSVPREDGQPHSFSNTLNSTSMSVDPVAAAATVHPHDKNPIHMVPSKQSHMRGNSFDDMSSNPPKSDPSSLLDNMNHHHSHPRNMQSHQYSAMAPSMHLPNGSDGSYEFMGHHNFEEHKPSVNLTSSQMNAYKRPLLTSAEKRSNHILSEQKRRDAIRLGFKDLVELLQAGEPVSGINVNGPLAGQTSPTASSSSKSPVEQKSNSSSTVKLRGRGRGRKGDASAGASKSALLGQGVRYIKWLERGNYALEQELQRSKEIFRQSSNASNAG